MSGNHHDSSHPQSLEEQATNTTRASGDPVVVQIKLHDWGHVTLRQSALKREPDCLWARWLQISWARSLSGDRKSQNAIPEYELTAEEIREHPALFEILHYLNSGDTPTRTSAGLPVSSDWYLQLRHTAQYFECNRLKSQLATYSPPHLSPSSLTSRPMCELETGKWNWYYHDDKSHLLWLAKRPRAPDIEVNVPCWNRLVQSLHFPQPNERARFDAFQGYWSKQQAVDRQIRADFASGKDVSSRVRSLSTAPVWTPPSMSPGERQSNAQSWQCQSAWQQLGIPFLKFPATVSEAKLAPVVAHESTPMSAPVPVVRVTDPDQFYVQWQLLTFGIMDGFPWKEAGVVAAGHSVMEAFSPQSRVGRFSLTPLRADRLRRILSWVRTGKQLYDWDVSMIQEHSPILNPSPPSLTSSTTEPSPQRDTQLAGPMERWLEDASKVTPVPTTFESGTAIRRPNVKLMDMIGKEKKKPKGSASRRRSASPPSPMSQAIAASLQITNRPAPPTTSFPGYHTFLSPAAVPISDDNAEQHIDNQPPPQLRGAARRRWMQQRILQRQVQQMGMIPLNAAAKKMIKMTTLNDDTFVQQLDEAQSSIDFESPRCRPSLPLDSKYDALSPSSRMRSLSSYDSKSPMESMSIRTHIPPSTDRPASVNRALPNYEEHKSTSTTQPGKPEAIPSRVHTNDRHSASATHPGKPDDRAWIHMNDRQSASATHHPLGKSDDRVQTVPSRTLRPARLHLAASWTRSHTSYARPQILSPPTHPTGERHRRSSIHVEPFVVSGGAKRRHIRSTRSVHSSSRHDSYRMDNAAKKPAIESKTHHLHEKAAPVPSDKSRVQSSDKTNAPKHHMTASDETAHVPSDKSRVQSSEKTDAPKRCMTASDQKDNGAAYNEKATPSSTQAENSNKLWTALRYEFQATQLFRQQILQALCHLHGLRFNSQRHQFTTHPQTNHLLTNISTAATREQQFLAGLQFMEHGHPNLNRPPVTLYLVDRCSMQESHAKRASSAVDTLKRLHQHLKDKLSASLADQIWIRRTSESVVFNLPHPYRSIHISLRLFRSLEHVLMEIPEPHWSIGFDDLPGLQHWNPNVRWGGPLRRSEGTLEQNSQQQAATKLSPSKEGKYDKITVNINLHKTTCSLSPDSDRIKIKTPGEDVKYPPVNLSPDNNSVLPIKDSKQRTYSFGGLLALERCRFALTHRIQIADSGRTDALAYWQRLYAGWMHGFAVGLPGLLLNQHVTSCVLIPHMAELPMVSQLLRHWCAPDTVPSTYITEFGRTIDYFNDGVRNDLEYYRRFASSDRRPYMLTRDNLERALFSNEVSCPTQWNPAVHTWDRSTIEASVPVTVAFSLGPTSPLPLVDFYAVARHASPSLFSHDDDATTCANGGTIQPDSCAPIQEHLQMMQSSASAIVLPAPHQQRMLQKIHRAQFTVDDRFQQYVHLQPPSPNLHSTWQLQDQRAFDQLSRQWNSQPPTLPLKAGRLNGVNQQSSDIRKTKSPKVAKTEPRPKMKRMTKKAVIPDEKQVMDSWYRPTSPSSPSPSLLKEKNVRERDRSRSHSRSPSPSGSRSRSPSPSGSHSRSPSPSGSHSDSNSESSHESTETSSGGGGEDDQEEQEDSEGSDRSRSRSRLPRSDRSRSRSHK